MVKKRTTEMVLRINELLAPISEQLVEPGANERLAHIAARLAFRAVFLEYGWEPPPLRISTRRVGDTILLEVSVEVGDRVLAIDEAIEAISDVCVRHKRR